jgi:hypothetical protein
LGDKASDFNQRSPPPLSQFILSLNLLALGRLLAQAQNATLPTKTGDKHDRFRRHSRAVSPTQRHDLP